MAKLIAMEIDLRQASPKPQTLEEAQKVIDALWEVLLKQGETRL